jgi:predicted O-methyltransferase YrrM
LDLIKRMAETTGGMMEPDTYVELYELARNIEQGNILDVGVGQGATTIAFALGLRFGHVYAVDQFVQTRTGPHRYSAKSNPLDAVRRNVAVFRSHLDEYGVGDRVSVFVGTTDEVAHQVTCRRVEILSIDVDGHIDRDLGHFYDMVKPDGYIVIDDYRDAINGHAKRLIEAMKGKPATEVGAYVSKATWHQRRRLLGKHLLTFRLANCIAGLGAMELVRVIGRSTAVFRKATSRPWQSLDLSCIDAVELSIVNEFADRCSSAGQEAG